MKIEVEFWTLVSLMIAFMGFVFTVAKMFFAQMEKRQMERFSAFESTLRESTGNLNSLERDLMALKAEMPLNYVRREDYVRGQTVIEAKLDALYNKLEAVQMYRNGGLNG
ncbi:hypothetical protein [Dickeya undicola]|uniref:DUF2730 family protein n=1 Tax=Dickeya undicola TaxID=1577887 RepID=A0A3N0FKR2_9GAMM|nr:hypothetical protein [Dickeya undicola]RNM00588.1 hypothetical protein EF878_20975 [Dickeya undicola]